MILHASFRKDWIEGLRKNEYSRVNTPLLEKMLRALALVEGLKLEGLDFTFKGGTALFLLFGKPRRLSIDVDIITEATREELENILTVTVGNYGFEKSELDEKRSYKGGIPKAHYNVYFKSPYYSEGINYVLLDVLYQKSKYETIKEVSLQNEWLLTEGEPTKLYVPTIDSILGDKLTAYAPNTTGILYEVGKEQEIIKQLFDIGVLFDYIVNFKTVKNTFDIIVDDELKYRNSPKNRIEVLDDIIETSLIFARREKQINEHDKNKYTELSNGIIQFRSNLLYGNFRIEEAIEASSKAAYLASKIKSNDITEPIKIKGNINIHEFMIENQSYNFLNRLKNLPENSSLFYWYQALQTMGLLV